MLTTKVHVNGHYDVTETPWAIDYVWVPREEEVEEHLLDETFHPWYAEYGEWASKQRAHTEEEYRRELEAL